MPSGNLREYSKTGDLLGTAQISGTNDIPESLTVLNGMLFVSDGSGTVSRVDLSTGRVNPVFNTGTVGLNGLGTFNGNLLTLNFSAHAVGVYSITGILQQTILLASTPTSDWNGITSDGTTLYLADYASGRIYEYSSTGILLGFIDTNLTTQLTGVAYDPSNHSLWISDASANRVLDLSTTGALLSQFSTGSFRPSSGVAVIPVTIPEPSYQGLWGISLVMVLTYKKVGISRRLADKIKAAKHSILLQASIL
ncbi:MAG: hypothetical protein JO185_15110 [Acidobacteriaceae bacterium]|nr:hypothetical protein [Acidobacteriaceae bacterium]